MEQVFVIVETTELKDHIDRVNTVLKDNDATVISSGQYDTVYGKHRTTTYFTHIFIHIPEE